MARIAIVHVPFYSHVEAARRLSRVLVRQGHELIVWAPEWWREPIEAEGCVFCAHEPEMPQTTGFLSFVADLAKTTEECTGPLIEQLFAEDVDLVIHDSQVPWARVAGEYLGLPRIVTHPMFPIVSPDHRSADDDDEMDDETEDPEATQAVFDARWLSIAGRWGVELGELDTVIHTAGIGDATVAFTTEEMIGDFKLGPGWHFVGPLMDEAPPAEPTDGRPLVYVCLGTSFNTRRKVFRAAIEGLADLPVDVLISTGMGKFSAADLEPLPTNVEVRDFVRTREVLAQARLHVTHGGCNSVHESLLAGVPMLLVPQAYDQFPLASRVERLGAGLIVEETPAAVRTAARWLVEDETVQARARELGQHLASYDGESRVAALIERVLAENAAVSA